MLSYFYMPLFNLFTFYKFVMSEFPNSKENYVAHTDMQHRADYKLTVKMW